MTAARIIKAKGDKVFTVSADASVEAVAHLLDQKRVGALVVTDDKGVAGVFSERDLVRLVARHGAAALKLLVRDGMTKDVIRVSGSHGLDEMLNLMTDRRIRHLPVMEGDRLLGVISIGDLVKHKIATVEADAEALRAYITT
jgi:CBS domain-containing protein